MNSNRVPIFPKYIISLMRRYSNFGQAIHACFVLMFMHGDQTLQKDKNNEKTTAEIKHIIDNYYKVSVVAPLETDGRVEKNDECVNPSTFNVVCNFYKMNPI